MGAYGYNIEQILMVDIIPDPSVRRAMNEINAGACLHFVIDICGSFLLVSSPVSMLASRCRSIYEFCNIYALSDRYRFYLKRNILP